MGFKTLNLRDAVMRIVDGTANTPNVVTVGFIDGSLQVVTAAPRPDDEYVNSQGKASTDHHFVIGDDSKVYEPISLSMTFLMEASVSTQKVVSAMSNPFAEGTWQPDDSTTFAPVTSIGSRSNGSGTSVACALPADEVKKDGLVHVEVFATNPDGSGDDFGIKLAGVYFTPPEPDFSNPKGTMKTTLMVFGGITDLSSGFTSPVNAI